MDSETLQKADALKKSIDSLQGLITAAEKGTVSISVNNNYTAYIQETHLTGDMLSIIKEMVKQGMRLKLESLKKEFEAL